MIAVMVRWPGLRGRRDGMPQPGMPVRVRKRHPTETTRARRWNRTARGDSDVAQGPMPPKRTHKDPGCERSPGLGERSPARFKGGAPYEDRLSEQDAEGRTANPEKHLVKVARGLRFSQPFGDFATLAYREYCDIRDESAIERAQAGDDAEPARRARDVEKDVGQNRHVQRAADKHAEAPASRVARMHRVRRR